MKKTFMTIAIAALSVALLLNFALVLASGDGNAKQIKGDFDGDGLVTSDDAVYLLRYTLFPASYPICNHEYTYWVTLSDATEDQDGVKELYCDECGQLLSTALIPAQGGIRFLTSQNFESSRAIGEVSDEFKSHYSSFAIELLQKCSKGDSAFISPLSVLTAMQMTSNGAKGQTAEEMREVLGGTLSTEEMNQELFKYYESLSSTDDAKFQSANAIWVTDRSDFTVNKGFIDIVNDTFRAQVARAPFTEKSTVDAINEWCSDNTDGMIPGILEYDDVGYDTIMVLLNALCFDALWGEQYDEYQCRDAAFHGLKGDKTVKMMYSEENSFISGAHETGFIKYYRGNYAFVALLPEEGMSMSEYLASLGGGRFASLIKNRKRASVEAGLPEFSFDWGASLVDVLQELGINTAFTARSDLSGLGVMDDGAPLAISDVIHKTHIEVDPSGTRAAAVTAVIVEKATSVGTQEKHTVILDRPFVYAIVDTGSMLPIFIGCINDIG